jgi:FAS-associated factor 2
MLLSPFTFLYRLLSGSFNLFKHLFPFLPHFFSALSSRHSAAPSRLNTTGRRPLNPRDTAARFAREFEEEYGSHSLAFFDNGYAQAYDLARKDLKFLLVVLISPEHDDTSTFVRETLLSQEVGNYINTLQNNLLLWAGNVQDSEAYQVSAALNCSKFPFVAVIAYNPQISPPAMSTIARITGLLPPSAFIRKLQTAISQHSPALENVRAAEAEQRAVRNLRDEQNSAYERSLAQDRERARQRREAEAERRRLEQQARDRKEAEQKQREIHCKWKLWRAQNLAPEPKSDVKEVTRISIRLPSGDRLVRKFDATARMEELYAFVECYDVLPSGAVSPTCIFSKPLHYEYEYKFRLFSPMPRTVYAWDDEGTIGQRIGRSGNLIVEFLGQGDEDEDEDDDDEDEK